MTVSTTFTVGVFNQAASNLGLSVRLIGPESNLVGQVTQANLTGWQCFQRAGFQSEGTPNEFLDHLIGGIDWMAHRSQAYLEYLRQTDLVEANLLVAKQNYEVDPSAENKQLYRCALRNRDLATRGSAEIEVDFSHLPEPAQQVVKILLDECMPRVERIYLAQMDPQNLHYLEDIIERGTPEDLFAFRFMGGVLRLTEGLDSLCSSHPDSPAPTPHQGFWPPEMTVEDINKVRSVSDELGSSFVVRRWEEMPGGQRLAARALGVYPPIIDDLRALAVSLRRAADVEGLESTVARFLRTRADELLNTENPYPFFGGDMDWIGIKGPLEVTLGFYEEGHSPLETVAIMEGVVGVVDQTVEATGSRFKDLLPVMEDAYAEDLGLDYRSRSFGDVSAPKRFVRAVLGADANARYVPAAYALPNIPPHGRREEGKQVFLLSSSDARLDGVIFPMARVTMDLDQIDRVQASDALPDIIGHENAHQAGPGQAYVVRNEGGQDIQVRAIFKHHAGGMEEARADMLGMASLPEAVRQGIITDEEAEKAAICFVASLMRGLALGEEDSHGVGAFLEFTALVENGGIMETPEGRYTVNLDGGRIFEACREIGYRINRMQMTGDYDGYDSWYRRSKNNLPERMRNEFLPILMRMPRDVIPLYRLKFSI